MLIEIPASTYVRPGWKLVFKSTKLNIMQIFTVTDLTIIVSRCINAHNHLDFCKAMTGIVRDM